MTGVHSGMTGEPSRHAEGRIADKLEQVRQYQTEICRAISDRGEQTEVRRETSGTSQEGSTSTIAAIPLPMNESDEISLLREELNRRNIELDQSRQTIRELTGYRPNPLPLVSFNHIKCQSLNTSEVYEMIHQKILSGAQRILIVATTIENGMRIFFNFEKLMMGKIFSVFREIAKYPPVGYRELKGVRRATHRYMLVGTPGRIGRGIDIHALHPSNFQAVFLEMPPEDRSIDEKMASRVQMITDTFSALPAILFRSNLPEIQPCDPDIMDNSS